MNIVTLTGRLANAPDVYVYTNGKKKVRLSVAVQRPYHKTKENSPKADFPAIYVFGNIAENCAKYLIKGQKVEITAHIVTAIKDGHFYQNIVADNVDFREKPFQSGSDSGTVTVPRANTTEAKEPEKLPIEGSEVDDTPEDVLKQLERNYDELDDDDIPF